MQAKPLLKKSLVVGIILLFIGVAVVPSINFTSVRASKAFFTKNEREALSAKPVLLELRHFKGDGSVSTQRMIVPYGKALDVCSHVTHSLRWNMTGNRDASPEDVYGDWIIHGRNCEISEDTQGSINLFIGTSWRNSNLNYYKLFTNSSMYISHDRLGITFSFLGDLLTGNPELPDDELCGFCIFRIWTGFIGWVASISFIDFLCGIHPLIPGPLKFEQAVEGNASFYFAVGIPGYF